MTGIRNVEAARLAWIEADNARQATLTLEEYRAEELELLISDQRSRPSNPGYPALLAAIDARHAELVASYPAA
jgi:hypothetical protein